MIGSGHSAWPVYRLGQIATIARESLQPAAIIEGMQYVGLEDISGETGAVSPRRVSAGELQSPKFAYSSAHLLYGKLRPNLRKVTRPLEPGICSTDILPLLPGEIADRDYLFHWLRTPDVVETVTSRTSGVNLPRISPQRLLELEVPLPPLAEQRRIAALLDRAEAVRRKREESRRLVEELLRSVFLEMFADPVRNEKGWEVMRVGDLCRVLGGKRLPKGSAYSAAPTPFRYIRAMDISHGRVAHAQLRFLTPEVQARIARYTVSEGDVVITIAGTIGEVAPVETSLAGANLTENAAKLCAIQPEVYDPNFLAALFRDPGIKANLLAETGQVTIRKLALFRIERVVIPVPPIELQRAYAERARSIERLRNKVVAAAASTGDLGAQIQYELLGRSAKGFSQNPSGVPR